MSTVSQPDENTLRLFQHLTINYLYKNYLRSWSQDMLPLQYPKNLQLGTVLYCFVSCATKHV